MPNHTEAILKATDARIPSIAALSPLARLLLQRIVRGIDPQYPSDPVQISNADFCQFLGVRTDTICRYKTELEDRGWIMRHQKKSRKKGMQVSETSLTAWAQVELDLAPFVSEKLGVASKRPQFSGTMLAFAS